MTRYAVDLLTAPSVTFTDGAVCFVVGALIHGTERAGYQPMDLATLEQVSAPGRYPAVAYLEGHFPNPLRADGTPNLDGREIGTGILIAPRLVLTAGHVVFDHAQGGRTRFVDVVLGGDSPMRVRSTVVHVPPAWESDPDGSALSPADLGVIVLPAPLDRFVAPMPFETASDTTLVGTRLSVLGYPANPRDFDPQPGPLGTLYGTQFNLFTGPAIPDGGTRFEPFRLFYPVWTIGGCSGGPIYDRDPVTETRTIRGIHTSLIPWSDGTFLASALRITAGIKRIIHDWVGELGQA